MSSAEIAQACPPDPRATINHAYERGMAATGLSAAGLIVVAYVMYRRQG